MSQQSEPIAIVGSGCRFSGGASSPAKLWDLLKQPRDIAQAIPPDRFDVTGFHHPDGNHHATGNVRQMYMLQQDLRDFDAQFFFISPNEADAIDPQQRLLLETVYEALEAGGHSLEALRGSDTAVYVGTMNVDYQETVLRDLDTIPTYFATGTNRAIISNRVSYFFDWHGPSMTIDTACSSSLVAVHQGVQALRTGESRVAIACGTQVMLGPEMFIIESKLKMLSPTGRSRMWDADADGYARGEGVASIVMKRLSDAIADGDHIECLIRETGANQDGYSNGLTVPSSIAQAALIRKTYAKAGLNLDNPHDRPQYFEAHGTGTKAGDPKEARAISECFAHDFESRAGATPLYVGSVKTVIGHTEGAAGLAGLLKAATSIQNGHIPPNLLFNRLNPAIEPFYQGLKIPVGLTPWPELPGDVPRRASVNSFGFGGSNAHAILEQYVQADSAVANPDRNTQVTDFSSDKPSTPAATPFLFSAASESSLVAQLQAYSEHLKAHPNIDPADLAWTLQERRSQLPFKVAFSASNIAELTSKIDEKLAKGKEKQDVPVGTRSVASGTKTGVAVTAHILGVFTGQGAQWAAMGAQLIETSPGFVSQRIQDLEDALTSLPAEDQPQWRLRDEMLADAKTSRIGEAELSQPLCTALQIVLVDLLRSAGVTFSAVVGHSSGEIGAAYAAGLLSDRDAIRVAYYRGLYARLAGTAASSDGTAAKTVGAMLAVGTSIEDAQELIVLSSFKGRLAVAAHNSSASVTLSGDVDAVILAQKIFKEEKKFARMLKVDTAYHSHHMLPCGDPYIAALQGCGISVDWARGASNSDCAWFSSVVPSDQGMEPCEELQSTYWRDNMTNAVLFADAVKNAVASDPQISLAVEVGPHPALKGPALQNIADVRPAGAAALPYTGVLSRGNNDVEAFADGLGFIWTHLGAQSVTFESYRKALFRQLDSKRAPQLVTGLPSYQWNHSRRHWFESRRSYKVRARKQPFHEILGTFSPDSTAQDLRWNNVLKMSEIPWLQGHRLQGQTVFPAAGYVALALEAARHLVMGDKTAVELFELHDLTIPKAITFDDDDNAGIETLVTLTGTRKSEGPENTVYAEFSCYSCPSSGTASASEQPEMELTAKATVSAVLGTPSVVALAAAPAPDTTNMVDVDVERFYSSLQELGYEYTGSFKTMSSMKRRLNQSSVNVSTYPYDQEADDTSSTVYLVHPTYLDVAFQAAILAFSAPGDGRLWSLHVPTSIGRIRVNPELCGALPLSGSDVPVWSVVTGGNGLQDPTRSSIDILGHDHASGDGAAHNSMVQVEDLVMVPFAPATAADDRRLFSYTDWYIAAPDGAAVTKGVHPPAADVELATLCDRVAYSYLRKWKAELADSEWAHGLSHHADLFNYVNHVLDTAAAGTHPLVRREWAHDTPSDIAALRARFPDALDLKLLSAVGEHMPAAVRGETTILEHMLPNGMLDDFYSNGLGLPQMNRFLADMVKQISHRYPHARILEIGAGTGSATKTVLGAIGNSMSSYTYTDISAGFFDKAAEVFSAHREKMTFRVLDAERSPSSQGFEEESYDIIIASNVLHATSILQRTLENTRKLLRPGGYLMLAELTNNDTVRYGAIMGSLSGWWAGVNDGRKYAPTLTTRGWHDALRKSGFAGIDAVTPELDTKATWPCSVMAAQAVDDRVNLLRRPLSASPALASSTNLDHVVIMGTQSLESSRITEQLTDHLTRHSSRITVLQDLPTEEEAEALAADSASTFINLVDLDRPIFKDMTAASLKGLKRMFEQARHLLWVTHGAIEADNPYHMASITFCRAMRHEVGHIGLSQMDLADIESENVSKTIAEHLLRQVALEEWEQETPRTDFKLRRHAFLWSKEREVFMNRRGKMLVPRLMDSPAQNMRLNSSRRLIAQPASGTDASSNLTIALRADAPPALIKDNSLAGSVQQVQTECSSLTALNVTGSAFLFLGIGCNVSADKSGSVIFLSSTNSSVVDPVARVPLAATYQEPADRQSVLVTVASELLAASVVRSLPPGSSVLVQSASSTKDRSFATALEKQARAKGLSATFFTVKNGSASLEKPGDNWISLNARAPKHVQKSLLPTKMTHFLDLTSMAFGDSRSGAYHLLPAGVKTIDLTDIARLESAFTGQEEGGLVTCLTKAVTAANASASGSAVQNALAFRDSTISLDQVSQVKQHHLTSTVTWSSSNATNAVGAVEDRNASQSSAQVEVRPIDANRFFAADKSYLLVGLTGEIGRSVCEWMVANGAGCVCLTSRNPKTNEKWLQSFEGTGAIVKVYPMDVTDKSSVAQVVADMRANCPPIAGIANGAMVLRDSLFASMSVEMMQQVLRPKIDGSNYLDELFYNEPLDFFIVLSSAVAVIGNSGQTAYAAANGYLNGLVRQRRKRGLAASAVDIGRVAGLGYVESAGQHVLEQLTRFGLMPISETEFHQLFAETIQAGYPASEKSNEDGAQSPMAIVTTGIRTVREDEEIKGPWFENPFFAHSVIETTGDTATLGSGQQDKKSLVPVREQLATAGNLEAAQGVLCQCFAAKLCSILQISSDTLNHNAPLVELGIDSLVAVEARSWFLKEVKVDIPVLKLVGGSSVAEICELAMKKLPEDLLAKVGTGKPAAPSSEPAPARSKSPPSPPKQSYLSTALGTPSGYMTPSSNMKSASDNSSATSVSTPGTHTPNLPPGAPTPATSITQAAFSLSGLKADSKELNVSAPAPVKFVKSEPMSVGQSRFWFLRLLVEDPTTFNVCLKYHMAGQVRIGDLERALRIVAGRHESLRTSFVADENEADQATQGILARSFVKLEHKKIASAEEAAAEYEQLRAHEFNLSSGALMRMVVLTLSPTSHYLLVNCHHIIIDMASFRVILSDMEKVYNGEPLGQPPKQYPEFSVAQRLALNHGALNDELEYWKSMFPAGEQPPVLPLLPMARSSSRTAMADYGIHQAETRLGLDVVERVKAVSKVARSTPFHFYLAAFKTMLLSFTDVQDLTIGIADANRSDDSLANSVGFFVNLLTLRFRRQAEQSFSDAVAEARDTAYAALGNSRLPFDVLLKELNVSRSSAHSPFFQAFFDYRRQTRGGEAWCGCAFDLEELHPGRTGYDISLDVGDTDTEALIFLRAQKCFYDATAVQLLLETYTHFVDILSRDASLTLQDTPRFSTKQLTKAVEIGRGPEMTSEWPQTLPHRIDQMAVEHQDKPALMDGLGSSLTYTAMVDRVEAIAEKLSACNIGADSRVLVYQQASTDWVCSMLAIMRIGAVYVPLDLRNPMSRLAALAKDCKPSAVLVDGSTANDAPQLDVSNCIDLSGVPSKPSARVPNSAQPDLPAAVLYTSGSTGAPKGIMIRHSGMRNEMEGYTKTYGLGAERVLQQSAFTFDFSVDQMFTGLVNGGMVYVVPWSKRGDPLSITEIIQQHSITYTKVTPSEYSMWLEYGGDNLRKATNWRFAFAGGEPLTEHILQQFASLDLEQLHLHNSYGPAEISIASHKGLIDYRTKRSDEDGPVPCGFSLPNYATYILDDNLKPLPVGMPGEVVIGGAGVSLGYLTNRELTTRVFVPNPYASAGHLSHGWTQMHRTGDIGHLREDGSLVFRDRIAGDTQVKLRGLRIDLRDIETNIISTAGGALKEAIVTLRSGNPEFLVAHVVFAPGHSVEDPEIFLEHLLGRLPLPQYMIPVLAVPLDRLPLTGHSKVDRKSIRALELPRRAADDARDDAEQSETMTQLRAMWRQVLGDDSEAFGLAIAPATSFFSVGGNSLLIVRLQAQIRKVFNAAVRLADLLSSNTLGEMARKIEESASVNAVNWEEETRPPSDASPLSREIVPHHDNAQRRKTILVTGSTGTLASHVLPALAADPDVGTIHCVAVRNPHSERAQQLSRLNKVILHSGDFSEPHFGLAEAELLGLAREADAIVHLGAVRSFWDNYHLLRPSNVDSTHELLRVAAPTGVPIHFVSTAAVAPRDALASGAAASAAAFEPPSDGSNGYAASKWASERLLERAAAPLAVPSTVYRFLPAAAAQQQASAKTEALAEFVCCVDRAGVMPDHAGWEGRIDLVPAKAAAEWLCASIQASSRTAMSAQEAVTSFAHYESPLSFTTDELQKHLEEQRGKQGLERLPVLKWMGRLKAHGFGYVLTSLDATVRNGKGATALSSRR